MEPIITDKLEQIGHASKTVRLRFPACTISKNGNGAICYLNREAQKLYALGNINWFKSDHYLICMPTKGYVNYAPLMIGKRFQGYSLPKELIEQGLLSIGSRYRLHPYKSGFALELYKPIS